MCVCMAYVNKTTCTRRPSDWVRNSMRTIYTKCWNRDCCVKGVFCLSSLFLSIFLYPPCKQTINLITRRWWWRRRQLNSTCECAACIHSIQTLYKSPGGENRVLCFIIIAYYYYYYCCVHYNINAVVNFMRRWQTRVYIIYETRFLLCAWVYTHVYNITCEYGASRSI